MAILGNAEITINMTAIMEKCTAAGFSRVLMPEPRTPVPLDRVTLIAGGNGSDVYDDGRGCIMNVVSMLVGEAHATDQPDCVDNEIRDFCVNLNDANLWTSDAERTEMLVPLIPLVMETKGDHSDPQDFTARRLEAMRSQVGGVMDYVHSCYKDHQMEAARAGLMANLILSIHPTHALLQIGIHLREREVAALEANDRTQADYLDRVRLVCIRGAVSIIKDACLFEMPVCEVAEREAESEDLGNFFDAHIEAQAVGAGA